MEARESAKPGGPRRVLVVAYYFPPMGFSGVQRISKFVRYLPDFGWEPTVLTVEPGGYFAYDSSLMDEVTAAGVEIIRTKSLDPTRLFGRNETIALPPENRRRALSELSQWIFIPDNKIGWLPFAVREGMRILRGSTYDAILSSAPPYTCHLIASYLSARSGVPLLLDYRDDWVDNPRHVYPTRTHRRAHQAMESAASRRASRITTINPIIAAAISKRLRRDVEVLEQGFDPRDFTESPHPHPATFAVTYTGVFYDAQRPDIFLRGVRLFLDSEPRAENVLRLNFAGTLPDDAKTLGASLGLSDKIHFYGYLPHAEVVSLQQRADVLWMTIGRREGAEMISTGKLFEYIGARRPVLALVPDGAARDVLSEYNLAAVCDPDDPESVASALRSMFDRWRSGSIPDADETFIEQFDRRQITHRLALHLNDLL